MWEWILLIAAIAGGYGLFKLHAAAGIISQVVSALIVIAFTLVAVGSSDFTGFFTANVWAKIVTIASLGIFIGDTAAELF